MTRVNQLSVVCRGCDLFILAIMVPMQRLTFHSRAFFIVRLFTTSISKGRAAFPVFRACGGLLLWHWCWGLSVYIWSRYRVNYIFLFDFDPRLVDTPVTIFNDCVDETLVFLVCMLLYYKVGRDLQSHNSCINVNIRGFFPVSTNSTTLRSCLTNPCLILQINRQV